MSRPISAAERQLSHGWVRPSLQLVLEPHRQECTGRCDALHAVINGASIRQAARRFEVNRNTLASVVDKAFSIAPDGAHFGYRACIPWIKKDEAEARTDNAGETAPYVLLALLKDHPDIERMLSDFKGALPKGRPSPAFLRLLRTIRELLKERGYSERWPFTTPDLGRRAFLRYIRKIRLQRLISAQPETPESTIPAIQSLRQLFEPRPYDRFEFDAHRKDVELIIVLPNAKGELVKTRITRVWILVVIEVNSTAVLGWKIVFGQSYSALDVAQCFAMAASKWEQRDLVAPDMTYVPGAGMPQMLEWGCMSACVTALDNAQSHGAALSLEAWVNYNDGIFHFGPAYTPEHRPYIELFFARLEAGAIRFMPGSFVPTRTLGDAAQAATDQKAEDHPVHIQAMDDLFEVIITGHNVSPIPARQHRSPMEILLEYELSGSFWRLPTRVAEDVKALTCHQQRVTVRGSQNKEKPVHVNVHGVKYRHPEFDKAWDMVGQVYWARIDLEDLRTITLEDDKLNRVATFIAAHPWHVHKHDLTTRRRILKLSRSGELDIKGAHSAVAAYAAYTLSRVGVSRVAADQAARLIQMAASDLAVNDAPPSSAAPLPPAPEENDTPQDSTKSVSRFSTPIGGYRSL